MHKRPVLIITLALILAAILTLAFSPDARAAVQALLTFNGVIVTIDEETGKLIVSGNLDAVIEQTDNSVFIQGENGGGAAVAVADITGEMVEIDEILADTPDLALPNVPASYSLDSRVLRMPDGALEFTWGSSAGYLITYWRSPNPPPAPIQYFDGGTAASESPGLAVEASQSGSGAASALPIAPGAQLAPEGEIGLARPVNAWIPTAMHDWEAEGFYHRLETDDPGITLDELMTMAP